MDFVFCAISVTRRWCSNGFCPTDPVELFDIDLLQKQIPVYSKNGEDNYFDKTMCGCKSKSECTWDDRQRRHRDKKGFFKMIASRLGH